VYFIGDSGPENPNLFDYLNMRRVFGDLGFRCTSSPLLAFLQSKLMINSLQEKLKISRCECLQKYNSRISRCMVTYFTRKESYTLWHFYSIL